MKHPILVLIISCLSLAACSNETQTLQQNSANATQTQNTQTQNTSAADISVFDSGNEVIAQVFLDAAPRIIYGNRTIMSKTGSSGKRKYFDENGNVLAKIKSDSQDKIKLKTESGALIWKIKTKTDSIKIANNEEMERSYKIKIKEPNRSKLLVNESNIGNARLSDSMVQITTQTTQINVTGTQTHTAAVMGFGDISLIHRLIILTELSQ